MKNRAFTLIELLAVVLIIGILSAIALPQYQRAVTKARVTEAIVTLKAITDAQEVYFLVNNEYTDDLSELDVQINPDGKYYTYECLQKRSCYAFAKDDVLPQLEFHMKNLSGQNVHSRYLGKHWCKVKEICKSFGPVDAGMGEGVLFNQLIFGPFFYLGPVAL